MYNVVMLKFDELFLATTDTIVGLGGPINENNKEAIYFLKRRAKSKSLIIMVGTLEQARSFKEWNEKAEIYAQKFWPGATTLVLSNELALRMPDKKELCELIEKTGPVYMTSANISGEKPLSLEEAKNTFNQVKRTYDFGPGSGQASKIIRVEDGEVLR